MSDPGIEVDDTTRAQPAVAVTRSNTPIVPKNSISGRALVAVIAIRTSPEVRRK